MRQGRAGHLAAELSACEGQECLRITGLPEQELLRLQVLSQADLARLLPVYPTTLLEAERLAATSASAAGRYAVTGESVRFFPRFPFLAGTSYTVLVRTGGDGVAGLTVQRPMTRLQPVARVIEIYPSAEQLPRNQLKLYVWFSHPMTEGQAADHVRVLRADTGEVLEAALLSAGPELWDSERRRLTLLFDPGRIKRGLVPHRELGYPLEIGVPVRVVVNQGFLDAEGSTLRTSFERRYEVGDDVRTRVDPSRWRCRYPAPGARGPLEIDFDRPLDHALLQRCIRVRDAEGRAVIGEAEVGPGERCWRLTPRSQWTAGPHRLVIDAELEDLAGNSVARVFDRDLARDEDAPLGVAQMEVEFSL